MIDDEDQDALAAEYVLGTLDDDEREQAQALVSVDAAFAALVQRWERRLGELQAMVEPVEPPAGTWDGIKARIAGVEPPAEVHLPDLTPPSAVETETAAAPAGEVVQLSRRLNRWRGATAALGALAATLLLFVALREFAPGVLPGGARAPASSRLVAVMQRGEQAPAFLLTVDPEARTLTARRISAETQPGQSYELWLVSPGLPAPRSLGVIGNESFTQRPLQAAYDANMLRNATYAISLEPEGGSRTGAPTGPVLWTGRLVEATPSSH
jgi:anti-sigma-K factor RskA